MNMPLNEIQIHSLAFYLWENDGSPAGQAHKYWEKALKQLEGKTIHSGNGKVGGRATALSEEDTTCEA
ncbi:DUF2934 domain-containing protein [Caballeronia insecticola]|uniref:DUF2934 domain-containing protein n=1 Tax=Caballeronia insecticola TaxID=758793 RepID=A0A060PJT0_9BURK|nr:DUF2934 domain-containing protein [Caballeronia insecticola]BAO94178.1 putative uncharacterized protein [Caballeronia insecticola]